MFGRVLEFLGVSGSVWECLSASVRVCGVWRCQGWSWCAWDYLGASGSVWESLGVSGRAYECLGASGSVWESLREGGPGVS